VGSTRPNASTAVPLQLEDVVGYGGSNVVELLFRLFPGSIRSPQVVKFLSHLLRHIPGKLLVVWDGLRSHRGRLVWDFVREQRGRIWLEFLPAYTPELNPVEYLWSHWKQHELPNFCPKSFGELSHYARKALRRMRRRPTLVMAFWEQAELFPL
jgi:transposase